VRYAYWHYFLKHPPKKQTHTQTHTHVDSFVGAVNNKSKPANGWARYIFIGCGWPPGGGQWTRAPPGFRHAPDFRQRRPPAGCAENWTRERPANQCVYPPIRDKIQSHWLKRPIALHNGHTRAVGHSFGHPHTSQQWRRSHCTNQRIGRQRSLLSLFLADFGDSERIPLSDVIATSEGRR
jgi:hypothetical protein